MALRPITVSQLNDYLSRVIGTDPVLSNVTVKGEASGVKYHSSGHVYFSLVDQGSRLNCFLGRDKVPGLDRQLTDGMELEINGSISIYKKGGSYSLYARTVVFSGAGDLAIAFEEMKKRLEKEGLFDQSHKKDIPFFPYKLGIVTSDTGAAIKDIMKIIRSRNDVCDILVFPVPVQGEGAAEEIASAVDLANKMYKDLDVLIVGRGGGSAEDLWAFNEEVLARSIYASEIPVISAVGHEIDFTISDMVADKRAETPTAAAQMAVPDTGELMEYIHDLKLQMSVQLQNTEKYHRMRCDHLIDELTTSVLGKIDNATSMIEAYRIVLEENDPKEILSRGYAIVEGSDRKPVTSASDVRVGDDYDITFGSGKARFTAVEKEE